MEIRKITGMKLKSGPFASTDIHNGGTLFGIIYNQIIEFNTTGQVTIRNEIIMNRASFPEWLERIENEKWEGTYSFASNDKHIECTLNNIKTSAKKKIYAAFVSNDCLMAEVYNNEDVTGKGQVFNKLLLTELQ